MNLTAPIKPWEAQKEFHTGEATLLAISTFAGDAVVLGAGTSFEPAQLDGESAFRWRKDLPQVDANGNAAVCIKTINGNRSDIRRVWCVDATAAGIVLDKGEGSIVDHCVVHNCGDAGLISRGDNGLMVSGLEVTGGKHSIVIQESSPGAGHATIQGGFMQTASAEALVMDSNSDGNLCANHVYIEGSGSHGIYIRGGNAVIVGGRISGDRSSGAVAIYIGANAGHVTIIGPDLLDSDGWASGGAWGTAWTQTAGYGHVVAHPDAIARVTCIGTNRGLNCLTGDLSVTYTRAGLGA